MVYNLIQSLKETTSEQLTAMALPPSDVDATAQIDWARLSEVPGLTAFAQLLAVEVTNGCVQWGFRSKIEGHLGVEPTLDGYAWRRQVGVGGSHLNP
ncbi:hypothetical protein FQK07_08455 [Synechococcus sp. BSF8S]|uniref:hypothetical protein n=1 Tax=Synechococcales TaxID=1890424 RepID=UPI00162503E0|nr:MULTISPECIES: hypothetical protein [unclassified Synechococcus]MBC1261303.1 hypothetical protein [Synechococcus sp. BSF8S]MBC1264206.1 hypothetical protein [Synechococcus sp. BSA11S]